MENHAFLQSIGVTTPETVQTCLIAMEKYGDDHWWEPDVDPRYFAYKQIKEDIMLCAKFSQFQESVELLLGRPIWTHEFGINHTGLVQEAERAWKWQTGPMTDLERSDAITKSMDLLRKWAREHGKQVIEMRLSTEHEPD